MPCGGPALYTSLWTLLITRKVILRREAWDLNAGRQRSYRQSLYCIGVRRAAGLMNWVLLEGEAPPSASPSSLFAERGSAWDGGREGMGPLTLKLPAPLALTLLLRSPVLTQARLTHTLLCSHVSTHMCPHCVWQEHVKRHACPTLGRR